MSEEIRKEQLKKNTEKLLQGPMKYVRAAALAAMLVPLGTVAVVTSAYAQQDCGASGQPPCPTPEPTSILILGAAGLAGLGALAVKRALKKDD